MKKCNLSQRFLILDCTLNNIFNLSIWNQILREAKAEADESKLDDDHEKDTVHYSQMFDEYQGLVHLEALEMLSKQSEAKIQMLLMRIPRNSEVRKNLEEIKSICENIPQFDDPAGKAVDFLLLLIM